MPLQTIILGREEISRVEGVVAHELECVSMKSVGTRFDHAIDSRARVHTVRGVLSAGGQAELLQRIGEWKGHARAVVVVDVRRAIQ